MQVACVHGPFHPLFVHQEVSNYVSKSKLIIVSRLVIHSRTSPAPNYLLSSTHWHFVVAALSTRWSLGTPSTLTAGRRRREPPWSTSLSSVANCCETAAPSDTAHRTSSWPHWFPYQRCPCWAERARSHPAAPSQLLYLYGPKKSGCWCVSC